MNTKLCLVLLAISVTLGCSRNLRLYPVQGQLAAQTPRRCSSPKLPVASLQGSFRLFSAMGKYVKEAGRRCRRFESRKVEPQPRPDTSGMSSVWDTVYGSGFYVSHVLGKKFYAQGSASGNHGTVVQMEMYMPEAEHSNNTEIKGVAKDTKDNIYKLVS